MRKDTCKELRWGNPHGNEDLQRDSMLMAWQFLTPVSQREAVPSSTRPTSKQEGQAGTGCCHPKQDFLALRSLGFLPFPAEPQLTAWKANQREGFYALGTKFLCSPSGYAHFTKRAFRDLVKGTPRPCPVNCTKLGGRVFYYQPASKHLRSLQTKMTW